MPAPDDASLLGAVRVDLRRLHEAWLRLAFPERRRDHPVMGQWRPERTGRRAVFRIWSALGALALAIGYPVAVVGFAVRWQVRRFDRLGEVLGFLGAVAVAGLVWGALAAVASVRFSADGFVAVAAAAAVATLAAGVAVVVSRLGSRTGSVLVAYPLGVTAVFLPPVVAALYSPAVAAAVFPRSESLAVWLLDNVLSVVGVAEYLRSTFDLVGVAYVGMWFAVAVPVGWLVGVLVSLANVARPSDPAEDAAS